MSIVSPQHLHHRVITPENGGANAVPLVLLHGLMGFSANWGKIWPHFSDRPVLVLDQRGHGRSEKPSAGYSPSDYAGDLGSLLKSLGWEKCHIVGHSMGGRVALRFANEFPEHTFSLTMEDSGVEPIPQRMDWIRKLLGDVPTPFHDRETAKKYFEDNFKQEPMTGTFLHANLETKDDGTINWRFYKPGMFETVQTGRATDAVKEFSALRVPSLLFRGSRSTEFPKEEAERMVKMRPGVELVVIEGAGHYVHAEKPQEFSAALKSFLTRIEQ